MLRYTTKEKLAGFLELLVENDKKVSILIFRWRQFDKS